MLRSRYRTRAEYPGTIAAKARGMCSPCYQRRILAAGKTAAWVDPEVEVVKVRTLAAKGMTDREIGDELAVGRTTVSEIRRKHGIPAGSKAGGEKATLTDDELVQALCRQVDPEAWFPEGGGASVADRAKRICAECPIRQRCLEVALENDERFGIWGGLDTRQRDELRHAEGPGRMMTAEQRADFYRRRSSSQARGRRAALDRAIAIRVAAIRIEQARRRLEAIIPDPEWLTAARRTQLDMDTRAFGAARRERGWAA